MRKPIVFSYKKYKELRDAYKSLLIESQRLAAQNRELQNKIINFEIKCRILEADKENCSEYNGVE